MEHIKGFSTKSFCRDMKVALKKGLKSMSEGKRKFDDVRTFEEANEIVKGEKERTVESLEDLFLLWKHAHVLEIEEWKDYLKKEKSIKDMRKPNTVPEVFLDELEKAMKYSFCGDGYIGKTDMEEKDYKKISNMWDEETGEPRKFTKFLILKEENHIQFTETEWGKKPMLYNSYYGKWAYDEMEPKGSTATILGKIIMGINEEQGEKSIDNWMDYTDKCKMQKLLKEFAVINVNKRGGGGKSDKSLGMYFEKYKWFFLKEINLLIGNNEPLEFIVFGKGVSYYNKMKMLLQNQFGDGCEVYNLSHPQRRMSGVNRKTEWEEARGHIKN